MKKRFVIRQLFHTMSVAGLMVLSSNAMASAFQLWEQDAASVGDYHSGRAAQANDASTSFYNPAGIPRIHNQEMVIGDVGVLSDIKYKGSVLDGVLVPLSPPLILPTQPGVPPPGVATPVTAQGGSFTQIPNFHYVAPINERLGFGLSVLAPFGLRTIYGSNTRLRYAGTTTELRVVDIAPALGFAVTKKFSIGAGLDYERMSAEFDNVAEATLGPISDTNSVNKGHSYAWGYHVGALYEFSPATRIGITFNSQVRHHLEGTSNFYGFIANVANGVPLGQPSSIYNDHTRADVTLPSYTTFSAFHQLNDRWDIKATAIYTKWNVFQNLNLYNVSGVFVDTTTFATTGSTSLTLTVPEYYRNTWNLSVGTDFAATDQITLRAGLGYDQSPVKDAYRNIQVPDGDRVALAFGGHYQATKTLGFDIGYTHLFLVKDTTINPPMRTVGAQVVNTVGTVQASADVFAASVTWDIT